MMDLAVVAEVLVILICGDGKGVGSNGKGNYADVMYYDGTGDDAGTVSLMMMIMLLVNIGDASADDFDASRLSSGRRPDP